MSKLEEALAAVKHLILEIQAENMRLTRDLRECRNEMCLRCGDYKRRHVGACDDCRWYEGKPKNTETYHDPFDDYLESLKKELNDEQSG